MNSVYSVAILAKPDCEADLVVAIDAHKETMEVTRRCADLAEILAAAHAGLVHAVCIDGSDPEIDRDIIDEIHRRGVGVILLAAPQNGKALHALGADAVISETAVDSIVEALLAIVRHDISVRSQASRGIPAVENLPFVGQAPPQQAGRGRVITVWGTSGAPGRTSVAVALACAFSASARTLLIDADTTNPSVAHALSLPLEPSALTALSRIAGRGVVSDDDIDRATLPVSDRLAVLTGLSSPQRWREIGPRTLHAVIDAARRWADIVVVDCAALHLDAEHDAHRGRAERDDVCNAALDEADLVVVVGRGDPIGIHRLSLLVRQWEDTGRSTPVEVLINRCCASSAGRSWQSAIHAALSPILPGTSVVMLPEDEAVQRALLRGQPLLVEAPDSAAATVIRTLGLKIADSIGISPPPVPRRRPLTLRCWLPHKKKH
ncbi:AAA family ATPase [Schaalia suimastitidis]|uniref:AAA family ATPase n=1 Tax=Schaalia suimastitidis TaxID=121163 RepID=UPI000684E4EF|nr:hypothetical protein [Schaalia suimastitidis]